MQLVLQQRLSERLLDRALTGARVLPPLEAHEAHDLVDVLHNPLNHIGVFSVRTCWNRAVSAALPRSSSSAGGISFSAATTSFAIARSCLRNSMLSMTPAS